MPRNTKVNNATKKTMDLLTKPIPTLIVDSISYLSSEELEELEKKLDKLKKELSGISSKNLNKIKELKARIGEIIHELENAPGDHAEELALLKEYQQIVEEAMQAFDAIVKMIIAHYEQLAENIKEAHEINERFEKGMLAFIERLNLALQNQHLEAAIKAQKELDQKLLRIQYLDNQIQQKTEKIQKNDAHIEENKRQTKDLGEQIEGLRDKIVERVSTGEALGELGKGKYGSTLNQVIKEIVPECLADKSIKTSERFFEEVEHRSRLKLRGKPHEMSEQDINELMPKVKGELKKSSGEDIDAHYAKLQKVQTLNEDTEETEKENKGLRSEVAVAQEEKKLS